MGTRDRERTVIEAVLDGVGHGSTRGLLLTGEPGIGRTTLLDHARRQAAARGWLVLAAAGDPAGSEHPFDALGVLVRHAIAADASLADRLSSALEVALGVERGRAEPTAIRAAVVRLLTDAASTRPVLLALDDVQWFDGSSIAALAFAHRHLAAEPVVTVATTLAGDEAVERAWGRVLTPITLGGLDLDELVPLLDGLETAPEVLNRCRQQTLGNPLGFVELVRRLTPRQRTGIEPLPALHDPGPVVTRAFAARLGRLPTRTRRALTVAAADESGRLPVVEAALASLGVAADLEPARQAGIITVDDGSIAFTHPLLRAAAYHGVAATSRRSAHRALAAALDHPSDAELRAWQLAAAAAGPDEEVAAALTVLADRAVARGADASAARVLERAASLSPEPRQAAGRLTAAGELWLRTRDVRAAADAFDRASGLMPAGELPVGTHLWGAVARRWSTGPASAAAALRAAAAEGGASAVLLAAAQDEHLLAGAVGEGTTSPSPLDGPGEGAGASRAAHDRARLRRAAARCFGTLDDVRSIPEVLGPLADRSPLALDGAAHVARAMVHTGRLLGAYGLLTAALAADPGTVPGARLTAEVELARVEALVGRAEEADARLGRVEEVGASLGMGSVQLSARAVRGLLALASSRFDQAVALLAPIVGIDALSDPGAAADHAEALAGAGRAIDATRWAATRMPERPAGSLSAGLLQRANGLIHDDRAAVEAAATTLEPFPFERARTLLLLAERWTVPGSADDARQAFESMAASTWASRAAAARGSRQPANPAAAALGSLTAAELRVAIAVGSGRSNREAADELFISVKTVDHHLQRIYRKLDIKGRSSLAVLVTKGATREGVGSAGSTAVGGEVGGDRARPDPSATATQRFSWLPPAAALEADDDPWASADLPAVSLSDEQMDFLSAFVEQPSLPRLRDLGDPTAPFEAT